MRKILFRGKNDKGEYKMNNKRRKILDEIHDNLVVLHEALDETRDEEECCKDNIPENLQYSERYQKAENAVEALENAISSIEEAIIYIEDAIT